MTSSQQFIYIGLLVIGILATFATAGLLSWLCSFSKAAPFFRSLQNLSPQVVAIVGILFALYTTFFASDIWNIRDRAQTAIQQEAEALRGLQLLAEQQPPAIGEPIMAAIRDYVQATIQVEWPLLARGEPPGRQVLDAWRQLLQAVLAEPVARNLPTSVHTVMLQALERAQAARYQRLIQSQRHGDPLKWFAVACLGAFTLLTIALVHLDHWRTQLAALLIYAAAISVSFAAAYLQRSPFQVFVVSPQPIAEVVTLAAPERVGPKPNP
ncbi:MAG TPA: DUF4239 domain-containing protein [Candidatus Competibacteraceae bacterium]|nr:MAG: DUF4239 domain-containing protein [Candidatus Competibacteraceae bacterium]HOB62441.1 DUF4239 domain-containing protein [Candidatus Competibacteraceae bacterium]HQA25863.1 DUF4239 domain-containing protein [Candidatus Competibacteraceae bacterium]HQD57196.1 DUF4239 domain-containing protein [Candidatus Competibacteraceae bacterium]